MSTDAHPTLLVAVLCAEWCGTCREYEAVYDALRAHFPRHIWHWIDIEDEADAAGDLDVETFPTLLVAHEGRVLFGGPVLPRETDAKRLIEALEADVRSGRYVTPRVDPAQAVAYAALASKLDH